MPQFQSFSFHIFSLFFQKNIRRHLCEICSIAQPVQFVRRNAKTWSKCTRWNWSLFPLWSEDKDSHKTQHPMRCAIFFAHGVRSQTALEPRTVGKDRCKKKTKGKRAFGCVVGAVFWQIMSLDKKACCRKLTCFHTEDECTCRSARVRPGESLKLKRSMKISSKVMLELGGLRVGVQAAPKWKVSHRTHPWTRR